MSRDRVAGVVILLAGLFVFAQPGRDSPWACVSTGVLKLWPEGLRICGWLPWFVIASAVGTGLVLYGAWLLNASRGVSPHRGSGLVALTTFAVVLAGLILNFSGGPFSPLYAPTPIQTGAPQSPAPLRSFAPPTR